MSVSSQDSEQSCYDKGPHVCPCSPSLFTFITIAQVHDVIFSDVEHSINSDEKIPDLFAENEI